MMPCAFIRAIALAVLGQWCLSGAIAAEPAGVDGLIAEAGRHLYSAPEKGVVPLAKLLALQSTFTPAQSERFYVIYASSLGFSGKHEERIALVQSIIGQVTTPARRATLLYQLVDGNTALGKYEDALDAMNKAILLLPVLEKTGDKIQVLQSAFTLLSSLNAYDEALAFAERKIVCAAFYGHPGIFACIGHMAIAEARAEGFGAEMLPGISAEDCLVADLGLDPGRTGLQSMETTQFMIYERKIDPTALLLLWQPGLAGELTLKRFDTTPAKLQVLVDKLARHYPLEHPVILYEAATHPLERPRMDTIPLRALPTATLQQCTTLVIPAAYRLKLDQEVIDQLKEMPEIPCAARQQTGSSTA